MQIEIHSRARAIPLCLFVLPGDGVRVQPADVLRHEVVPRQDPHHGRPLQHTQNVGNVVASGRKEKKKGVG
jgi:hypothetical protein